MSTLTLQKGNNVALGKVGLTGDAPKFRVALGWDPATTPGVLFDLDASAIIVDVSEKVLQLPMLNGDLTPNGIGASFVFYNQRGDAGGALVLSADDRTGGKTGDDETLDIDCGKLPAEVDRVIFAASIHEAGKRGQNFGQVKKAYIRILSGDGKTELVRYDLSEDASADTAMLFGELYRKDGGWKFRALGTGTPGGLEVLGRNYGVNFG